MSFPWPCSSAFAACAAVGLGIASTPSARAEFDAEKYLIYGFGDLSLRPRLEVRETYDSNLFYAEDDVEGDLFTQIRPGLTLMYGRSSENFTAVTYQLDSTTYASKTELNYLGHILNHNARIQLGRTLITGNDSYTLTRSTLGGTFSYLRRPVGLSQLRDQWQADYDASPKATLGVDAGFEHLDYDASDLGTFNLYDSSTLSGGLRAGYIPSDRLVIYPQFSYHRNDLKKNVAGAADPSTLSAYGISMGARGEFTPKLTGVISGGYEFREYEDGTAVPDGWIANTSLRWQIRAKTAINLSYRHWIQVARDARGTAYTVDRPSIGITQQIGTQGRWTLNLDGYLQYHDYGDGFLVGGRRVDRSDDLAGVTASTSVRWTAWLTATASYDFSTYSDNIASIPDYEVHRIALRLVAGF